MLTRREVLILGVASCVSACGGGGATSNPDASSSLPDLLGAKSPPDQGTYGVEIANWTQFQPGSGTNTVSVAHPFAGQSALLALQLSQSAPPAYAHQPVVANATGYVPRGRTPGFSVGVWVKNPNTRTLDFVLTVYAGVPDHALVWECAIEPSTSWTFLTMSPSQQNALGWIFGTDAVGFVRITQADNQAEGPWQPGEFLLFANVYVDVASRPLFLITFDDGNDSQRNAPTPAPAPPGIPVSSGQQLVEAYGFKGSLFLVPSWLGTAGVHGYGGRHNRFMSAADAQAMYADGWSVGSHSQTHPSNAENAGLRLLGPYGYFLSNTIDNLSALYVKTWQLDASRRRRVIGAEPGTNVLRFENRHYFLVNMPIVFTDEMPPGFAAGTIYYCQTIPSETTATFATDQGSLLSTALVTAAWAGLGNYRYSGAANDDTAIFADIMGGVAGLEALGISTGSKYFALPQGSADAFVRSACIRAKLRWVRGASDHAHTIPVGLPTGGGLSGIDNTPGGWLAQLDCIQTDGIAAPSIDDIRRYIDDTITQGACGCSYHHAVGQSTLANLNDLCAYLKRTADAGLIDVVTLDQMAAVLRL